MLQRWSLPPTSSRIRSNDVHKIQEPGRVICIAADRHVTLTPADPLRAPLREFDGPAGDLDRALVGRTDIGPTVGPRHPAPAARTRQADRHRTVQPWRSISAQLV